MFVYSVVMFSAPHSLLDGLVVLGLSRPELEAGIGELSRLEAHVVERRLAFTAAIDALGDGGIDGAGINRSRGHHSKKASTKAADTAKQLTEMPQTRAALASGEICQEHANAAAAAAGRISPRAADTELAGLAKAQPADMFASKARDWASTKEKAADIEARHNRQRSLREWTTWTDNDGMLCLFARLDPIAGKELTTRIEQITDQLWRTDGGRDGTPNDIRTPTQRRADALTQLAAPTPTTPGTGAGVVKRPHPKHLIMIAAHTNRLRANNATGQAQIIDGQPLPQTILEQIACNSAFAAAIYDTDGAVMWQGRTKRLATDDQWNQLIIRDKGCVICSAPAAHCEAHHLTPFAPPTNGNTNIDEMILVCPTDHHHTHTGSHRLTKTRHGWQLQPTNHPNQHRKPEPEQHHKPTHETSAESTPSHETTAA